MLTLFAIFLGYLLSLWGWGRLLGWISSVKTQGAPAFTATIGLAAVAFLGGALGAASAVSTFTLDTLLGLGVALAVVFFVLDRRRGDGLPWFDLGRDGPLFILIFGYAVLLGASLYSGNSFNIYDDLSAYLARPIRLLSSGTLAGDPLSGGGSDTLGIQSFFQAFVAAHFPIRAIPVFDTAFCGSLAAALGADIARRLGRNRPTQFVAAVSFLVVNPCIVNITSVYSAALATLALVLSLLEAIKAPTARTWILPAIFTALLLGFKATNGLLAATVWLSVITAWLLLRKPGVGFRQLAVAALGVVAFIGPWIAIYMDDQIALHRLADLAATIPPPAGRSSFVELGFSDLLTFKPAFYGSTYGAYGCMLVISLVAPWLAYRLARTDSDRWAAIIFGALSIGALVTFWSFSVQVYFNTALRFTAPTLAVIATLTAVFVCGPLFERRPDDLPTSASVESSIYSRWPIVLTAVAFVVFAESAFDRFDWASRDRTQISYPSSKTPQYRGFIDAAFGPSYQNWISGIQQRVPAGETILVWHSFSFLMDYRRNHILNFNQVGFVHPWMHFPPDGGANEITRALRMLGVRYIVWEYDGFAVYDESDYRNGLASPYKIERTQATLMLRMWEYLDALGRAKKFLYTDGRIMIVDLDALVQN